jgi:monoamine oxidase
MGCNSSMPSDDMAEHLRMDESLPLDHDVIVVGAGIAGLACASRLKELGIGDVAVLEARERHGGRVHTVSTSHGPLDLGAAWVHGVKGTERAVAFVLLQSNVVMDWLAQKPHHAQHAGLLGRTC